MTHKIAPLRPSQRSYSMVQQLWQEGLRMAAGAKADHLLECGALPPLFFLAATKQKRP